jgi:hypothetical protein
MGDAPRNSKEIEERIRKLANPSLLAYILKRNGNKREMYIRWPHDVLYFCGDKQGVMLSNNKRDKALSDILRDPHFTLKDNSVIIPDTNMFWGFDIDFIYRDDAGKTFNLRWYREQNNQTYDIYLMDENWNYMRRANENLEAIGDKKLYYCFNFEENSTLEATEQVIDKINCELNKNAHLHF